MIESRCGILCSECDFRRQGACAGCLEIAKPFWGECPVKACCEGRSLPHCGVCGVFPCELLNAFAHDSEHGDEGRRIAQCGQWCESVGGR